MDDRRRFSNAWRICRSVSRRMALSASPTPARAARARSCPGPRGRCPARPSCCGLASRGLRCRQLSSQPAQLPSARPRVRFVPPAETGAPRSPERWPTSAGPPRKPAQGHAGHASRREPPNAGRAPAHHCLGRVGSAHVEAEASRGSLGCRPTPDRTFQPLRPGWFDDGPVLLPLDRPLGHAQFADLPVGQLKLGASTTRGICSRRNNLYPWSIRRVPSQHRFDAV